MSHTANKWWSQDFNLIIPRAEVFPQHIVLNTTHCAPFFTPDLDMPTYTISVLQHV